MDRARPNTCYIQAAPRAHTSRRARKPGIAKTGPAPPDQIVGGGTDQGLWAFRISGFTAWGSGFRVAEVLRLLHARGRSLNEHRN